MYDDVRQRLQAELDEIRDAGLCEGRARHREARRAPDRRSAGREVLNFCANNYLGLANHPALVAAAQDGLARWGFGLASVRFICGTQTIHKELEAAHRALPRHRGRHPLHVVLRRQRRLFETLLGEDDAIISRRAQPRLASSTASGSARPSATATSTATWPSSSACSRDARDARTRLIATDGVFSMDGDVAPLAEICDLADRYDALVMVDDSHATGFFGPTGAGHAGALRRAGRVDIITSHARQGARRRQRRLHGRPAGDRRSLCASARARTSSRTRFRPPSCAASLACLELLSGTSALRDRLAANTRWFRGGHDRAGFRSGPGSIPSCPSCWATRASPTRWRPTCSATGIYVVGFSYPGGAEGPGAHTRPDQRRPRAAPSGARGGGLRGGRPRPWRDLRLQEHSHRLARRP